MDAQRQLERAGRLLDFQPHRKTTPVHKSLEQLFGEARSQPHGGTLGGALGPPPAGGGPLGVAGVNSRLLQNPQAQRLEREVEVFTLGPGAAGGEVAMGGHVTADAANINLGVREFFGFRHEKVLLNAVEEAHRDCMRSIERQSFERIQADWEETKAHIMAAMAPQRFGASVVGSALRGVPAGDNDIVGTTVAAPPQDSAIIDALMRQPPSQTLALHIARLSCNCCPAYHAELEECWGIVSRSLEPSVRGVTCGALRYLQERYADEMRTVVRNSIDLRLGGIPDSWSMVRALGRAKFGTMNFPSTSAHVWYAAYVAARTGDSKLLAELPERAASCADRCHMFRTVCSLLARRLQATTTEGQPQDFASSAGIDSTDLLRADLSEEDDSFHNVLVSLLLERSFNFGRLPEGTVEDWLWFRLHAIHIAARDQPEELLRQLEGLRNHVLALPPSHFDPPAAASPVPAGPGLAGAWAAGGAEWGAFGSVDPLDPSGQAGGMAVGMGCGAPQTLNLVKALLLTAQFGRAVQQLRAQDRSLRGPALHMALVLHRAGSLEALAAPEPMSSVAGLVCEYASQFSCSDQLQYFRVLNPEDRVQALERLLLRGGAGTNEDLLGHIDNTGRHRPGLLEQSLQEDGGGDRAEFVEVCAKAGRSALEHGQYREAIRLLHLGKCHGDVLQVLCRCLRLPLWREASAATSDEAVRLSQDIQRFFQIYERNLDRYALSSHSWAVARKLYAARTFHSLCLRGQPEAALDLFDREQLLPLGADQAMPGGPEMAGEALAEYPRIVGDYVRILQHAASQGVVVVAALRARVQQLQSFLALHSHHLALDHETAAALASLALA